MNVFSSLNLLHYDAAFPLSFQREIVDRFLQQPDTSYSVIIDNVRKVYPPKDGNAEVVAVKGFSLSIHQGQCFGLLVVNGAGKPLSLACCVHHILYSKFVEPFIDLQK